jgi:hypothetical protein
MPDDPESPLETVADVARVIQEALLDLAAIESEAIAFATAKAKATTGKWYRGAWCARCKRHPDGQHPVFPDPADPCVIARELTTQGDHASWVSVEMGGLVGSDEEGPILSRADAEFIVAAKNTELERHVVALVAEVRRLHVLTSLVTEESTP